MKTAGIDIGSRFIKLVVLEDGEIAESRTVETSHNPLEVCRSLLADAGTEQFVATGYGRYLMEVYGDVPTITEIKAVALGARTTHPGCRTIIDIGGQDTKVITLDERGRVIDFEMNDRCAAGTGRFLEIMARTLGYPLEKFGQECSENGAVSINSMCTVFAESEVVSLIAKGIPRAKIASALHASVASRVVALAKRHPVRDDVVFAGGCARNICLCGMIEERLSRPLMIHNRPEVMAAYGAALLAAQQRYE
ncbi:MAG TPA: acyl-CoA dehydratase activase [Dissulfurispiraceae bacterium]|nr:acyl-CoA dehydratase activase [Dissulfurispiraceae bacterium]